MLILTGVETVVPQVEPAVTHCAARPAVDKFAVKRDSLPEFSDMDRGDRRFIGPPGSFHLQLLLHLHQPVDLVAVVVERTVAMKREDIVSSPALDQSSLHMVFFDQFYESIRHAGVPAGKYLHIRIGPFGFGVGDLHQFNILQC